MLVVLLKALATVDIVYRNYCRFCEICKCDECTKTAII